MSTYPDAALTPVTSDTERWLAAIAHGSLVVGLPVILPVVTLALGTWVRPSSFVKRQSLQALIFHVATFIVFVTVLVLAGGSGIIAFVRDAMHAGADGVPPELPPGLGTALLIVFLDMLFLAWTSILGLIATVRTFQGRDYRYPLIGRLF